LKNKYSKFFYLPEKKPLIAVVLICLCFASYLGQQVPLVLRDLFSAFESTSKFFELLSLLAIIFGLEYINRVVYQLSINKYVQFMIVKVRKDTYESWLGSYEIGGSQKSRSKKSDDYPLGEVLARVMSDTEAVRELINSGSFAIFIDLFFVFSCFYSFIGMNRVSGSFLMGVEVLICIGLYWGSKSMAKVFLQVRRENANVSRTFSDLTESLNQAYFLNHRQYLSRSSELVSDQFLKVQLKANVWDAAYYSLAESLFPLLLVLFAFIYPYSHITELAVVVAMIDLIQRSINPIKDVAGKMSNFQRAGTGIRRIVEFIEDSDQKSSKGQSDQEGIIDVDRLSVKIPHFSYSSKTPKLSTEKDHHLNLHGVSESRPFELRNIDFEANRGEMIGVVGKSGSGKSTLLNLLTGNLFFEASQTRIEISSGHNQSLELRPGSSKSAFFRFRKHVGIVSQESHIFTGSLAFNVSLEGSEVTNALSEFWKIVRERVEYVRKWGIQLDSQIAPSEMSVGQKQLIAALRACYQRRSIVFFDEISSALDSQLEEGIRSMIRLVQEKALTFIVAHRIETIIEADKLLVLDQGRLVDQGPHAKLMQRCDLYRQFVREITIE
jgi:ATP-binding cassette subfamily B protein